MKKILGVVSALLAFSTAACVHESSSGNDEGGANVNDRSSETGDSELLYDGAMAVSPSGDYIVARRRASTLVIDVKASQLFELETLSAERFLFARSKNVVYAVLPERAGVVALDLATRQELWRAEPIMQASAQGILAKLSNDESTLLLGDATRVLFLDAATGNIRGATTSGPGMADLDVLPGGEHAIVVGTTRWENEQPHTPVSLLRIDGNASVTIDVPNCAAPVAVVRGGSRALLSPTFCEPPKPPPQPVDPVSVIDIDTANNRLTFVKNLPGFGPVAMLGETAVAYLDTKRMVPSMFDDPAQIPGPDANEYHLMAIDPASLAFDLHPIGDALPRFAPSKDGKSLLVDASVTIVRTKITPELEAGIQVTPNGQIKAEVSASLKVFSDETAALFGVFHLDTKRYTPFQGPAAALDRFVQVADGSRVFTLKGSGFGGALFSVDVGARSATDLGKNLRDIAILPDGQTLVLRSAVDATGDQEDFCFSRDARTCTSVVHYVAATAKPTP